MCQGCAVNETPWQRLYRLAEARREHLGMSRADVKAKGGPSSESVRKLQHYEGAPSIRQAPTLRDLDAALNWPLGTAWGLVADGREGWGPDALEDEEHSRIFGDEDSDTAPDQRHFETILHATLREMPADEREQVMAEILKVLNRF